LVGGEFIAGGLKRNSCLCAHVAPERRKNTFQSRKRLGKQEWSRSRSLRQGESSAGIKPGRLDGREIGIYSLRKTAINDVSRQGQMTLPACLPWRDSQHISDWDITTFTSDTAPVFEIAA
jgi:hypothetical protein